jgi:uncharacterized protein YutD
MVDYFKLRGILQGYSFDEACIRNNDGKKDTNIIGCMKIPNRTERNYLEFSYLKEDPKKVIIRGNLRKWWFDTGHAVHDLNFTDLRAALRFLASRLGVDSRHILLIDFAMLELGGNIKLERKYDLFIPSLIGYPKLSRTRYDKTSVYFVGTKVSLIVYDVLSRMKNRGEVSAKTAKRMMEQLFIMRFEIKIAAKSGYKHKAKVANFGMLLKHYDFLVDDWLNSFMKMEFIDLFSGEKEIAAKSLSKKKVFERLIYYTLKEIGLDFSLIIADKFITSHNTEARRDLQRIFNSNRNGKKWNYYTHISSMVAQKAQLLKA